MSWLKDLLGISRLEKRVEDLEKQLRLTTDRAQMNNLRTLMMLEHGDFPTLDGRAKSNPTRGRDPLKVAE